jgi:hypothetical protein
MRPDPLVVSPTQYRHNVLQEALAHWGHLPDEHERALQLLGWVILLNERLKIAHDHARCQAIRPLIDQLRRQVRETGSGDPDAGRLSAALNWARRNQEG